MNKFFSYRMTFTRDAIKYDENENEQFIRAVSGIN